MLIPIHFMLLLFIIVQPCIKRSHVPIYEVPKPYDRQGWIKEAGILEPLWPNGPVLPPSLVDLLDTRETEEEDESDEDADYYDLFDFLEDDDE